MPSRRWCVAVLVSVPTRAVSHLDAPFHWFIFPPWQVNIELPHVNVLTKLDLVRGRARQDGLVNWRDEDEDDERELIIPERESLLRELNEAYSHSKWLRLNEGIVSLLDEVCDTLVCRLSSCPLVLLSSCLLVSSSVSLFVVAPRTPWILMPCSLGLSRPTPVELDWVCRVGSHERRFDFGGPDES